MWRRALHADQTCQTSRNTCLLSYTADILSYTADILSYPADFAMCFTKRPCLSSATAITHTHSHACMYKQASTHICGVRDGPTGSSLDGPTMLCTRTHRWACVGMEAWLTVATEECLLCTDVELPAYTQRHSKYQTRLPEVLLSFNTLLMPVPAMQWQVEERNN